MTTNRMGIALWLSLLSLSLVSGTEKTSRTPEPRYANDMGPAEIDVSDYPPRMQTLYRSNFQKNCSVCHTPARALNSEFLEIDGSALEELRRSHPAWLADPWVLKAGKDIWKKYVKQMKMRPPCCGACPVMTLSESRDIWEFLVYDSIHRKTGVLGASWQKERRALLKKFSEQYPEKFKERYE